MARGYKELSLEERDGITEMKAGIVTDAEAAYLCEAHYGKRNG